MMTRTMTGMLIVVLAMASSAHAVFNEDFEGYGPAGTDISNRNHGSSDWISMGFEAYGETANSYTAGEIAQDTGTNGTLVSDLINSARWGSPKLNLPSNAQFSSGSVSYDMYDNSGATRAWFATATDGNAFSAGSGIHVVNLSYTSGVNIFERNPGGNVFDVGSGGNKNEAAIQTATWQTHRVEFDFEGGVNGNGEWQLFVDNVEVLSGAMTTDSSSSGRTLQRIGWDTASGTGPLLDNIRIVPEPATCMLFAGGLLCLLRRRA